MTISQHMDNGTLTIAPKGRLDSTTSPLLSEAINGRLDGVTTLVLDLADLAYISSAGLRVILTARTAMARQGDMKVTHVNESIMEIFEITGFVDLLTIE